MSIYPKSKNFKVGDRVRITSKFPESEAHGLTGTVTYVDPGRRYPFTVSVPDNSNYSDVQFTPEELELAPLQTGKRVTVTLKSDASFTNSANPMTGALTFTFTGDVDVETEDLTPYVRVKVQGKSGRYTYRDTSGMLQVGDVVEVPFGSYGGTYYATVVELGRGAYTGPVKDVSAKMTREEIAA